MNNSTSTFTEQPKGIDFTVMGFYELDSDFLNWCLKHRNNLEWLKEKQVMESVSTDVKIYFDQSSIIQRIDKLSVDKR